MDFICETYYGKKEIDRATEILRAMAECIDLFAGEVLPDDSAYNRTETFRAFHCILNKIESRKTKATKDLLDNAGKPRTKEDDMALAKLYAKGISNKALAKHFGRTTVAITSIKKRLDIIDEKKNDGY